ncbi:Siderophore peptide synthetase involved in ferrichromeA biosynthesis [Sporisorium reilianum f. sp. reilianum]|uniref:Siderophore peptide synthetase involved in ferrichromeA biosynthesis n=1 Tax=Sporisorium reilianum f. sp. reilianum TaxID=72559 RepID=A0A2N8U8Y1_9BASI|nr:Siderophore peptide synthetase involved in ferrichromeA biosynthesis [Sporisorium reilianum f. sp. reilianum]
MPSRLPSLHPYSNGTIIDAQGGDKTFKFTLQESQESVNKLASPEGEHRLITSLATFVAQLIGYDADEVLFKLRVGARHPCVASADGVKQKIVDGKKVSPPGIAFCFLSSSPGSSPASSSNDDLTIAVDLIRNDDKNIVQVMIDFALPVPDEAARGICAHFCRRVLNSDLFEPAVPLSILNASPTTSVTKDTKLHHPFLEQAQRTPDRVAVQFLEKVVKDGAAHFSTLTYSELRDAAFVLASKIRTADAKSGKQHSRQVVVPMLMTASLELYVSYIAILMAGFAFCPLPVDAPDARLASLLAQLDAAVLLGANSPEPPQWAPTSVEWINVADILAEADRPIGCAVRRDVVFDKHTQECAYVLFTSGTTGTPKGVQISHHSASVSIAAHAAHLHPSLLQPRSATSQTTFKWFQFASTVFDPSVMEIFVTLSSGGTFCSAPRALTLSDLETVVRFSGADIMMATPSVATLLRPHQVPTLRFLWTMGESLNATVIRNFAANDGRTWLANAYGPTEASVNCTLLQPFSADYRGSIIGKPLPSCSLAIVHERYSPDSTAENLEAAPSGVTGELVIGGPHVGMGYLNMPDATEDAFTTFTPLGRVYRTRDRARLVWDRTGNPLIEILGRMNAEQVKLSGRRVELGEVDSVLQSSDLVQNAANVIWRPASSHGLSSGSERLVCCIVLAGSSTSGQDAEADCRAIAEAHLPPHMRPWKYVVQPGLPVTVSGKSDRKRLAQLVAELMSTSMDEEVSICRAQHQEARLIDDPIAQALVEAIGAVCQLEASSISMDADLFELGVDSLAAMRLLQLLRNNDSTASVASRLNVAQVLKAGSCADLADLISSAEDCKVADHQSGDEKPRAQREQEWSRTVESFKKRCRGAVSSALFSDKVATPVQDILPTTATQSGMLTSFLTRDTSSGAKRPYINHTIYHMTTSSEARKLHDAFRQAAQRHDIFRTVFVPVDDRLAPFAQCIFSTGAGEANVSKRSASTTLSTCLEEHLEWVEGSISLDQPPWHLGLLLPTEEVDDAESLVVLSMMHAIFDGGSLDLLQQEATALFNDDSCSPSSAFNRTQLESAVQHHYTCDLEGSRRFWKEKLQGVGRTPFPCVNGYKSTMQSGLSNSSSGVIEVLSRSSMDKISRQARCQRTSVLALLQTAWNLLLAAYAEDEGVECIVSGSVQSGRLDEETKICMAPTFNVVPFITRLGNEDGDRKDKTIAQLLAEATAASTAALDHLEIPLGALATSGSMPFDTLFAVQRFDGSISCERQRAHAAAPWTSVSYPVMSNDFAVMVEVWPAPHADAGLRLRLTYSPTVLDAPSAELLLQQYDDTLHRLMREPDSTTVQQVIDGEGMRPSALSMSHHPESAGLDAKAILLHTQFETKAVANPNATALEFFSGLDDICEDGSTARQRWTYDEVNARANGLARLLLSITGQTSLRDQPVPICMERCAELYVAVLAVLKAGGAWCPIDVQSPRTRQLELIAKTGSRIILVSPTTSSRLGTVQAEGRPLTVQVDACDASTSRRFSSDNLGPTAAPETLAYLIWTSGTTGAPKGVMIEHGSAVTSMQALQHHVRPPQQDQPPRCLQFSAYTFDVFVQDLFWTWGLGGTVVATTREIMLGSTAELIAASQANHAHLTPAFAAGLPRASCPGLRSVTFIGEKLTESVAADWTGSLHHDGRQLAPTAVYNTYGPAEVTVVATLRRLNADDRLKSANVGVPMRGVSAFVCRDREQSLRPCGKGTVGELVLAGAQVGRGYLEDQQKTEAAFKSCLEWQQRLYYTGDYVRMLHDGSIEFIGRRDDLVKLGGIRVELSEISAALVSVQKKRAGPVVERAETMMLSRPDRPSKQVISFLACPALASADGTKGDEAVSASFLLTSADASDLAQKTLQDTREVLPPYMVPSSILVLSHIPQTASAKIDRARLQAAYSSADLALRAPLSSSLGDPQALAEENDEAYASLSISEITGTPTLDINAASSLASIGLDSIRTIRLAAKLKQDGVPVLISTMLACSTVRMLVTELVSCISRGDKPTREDERSQLLSTKLSEFDTSIRKLPLPLRLQEDLEACFPCSGLQEGMLTETLADPLAYWIDHVVRLGTDVDLDRFAQAWERTANTIDMLRTVFAIVFQSEGLEGPLHFDGEIDVFALQMLHKSAHPACIDVGSPEALPSEDQIYAAVSEWRTSVASDRAGVRLGERPLWAVKTFNVGGITYAALCIHHALYDGPSVEIILDRVRAEYTALGSKQAASLPALTSLSAQRKNAFACTADERRECLQYWEKLRGRGPAALLPDLTSAKVSSKGTAAARFMSASRSFRYTASRPLGVGISTLIKTAFAVVLGQYIETEDHRHVVLGEVLSLRHLHASLSTENGAVGPLLTTLPFSLLLTAASKHESLLSCLESGAVAHPSIKNRFASLGALAKILGTRPDQEMFTAMYAYHQKGHLHDFQQTSSPHDECRWTLLDGRSSEIRVEHGTVLNVLEQGETDKGDLLLELSMKEDRISKDMLEVLLDQVISLLNLMIRQPDETCHRLLREVGQGRESRSSVCSVPRGTGSRGNEATIYRGHDPLYWLEHHAETHPSWPAVVVATGTPETGSIIDASLSTYTYAELRAKADQVSALIRSLDLPADGPIALCMQRSLISLAVTVAIFKCGRTYLPIDDQLPAERKRLLISDSSCALIVTEGRCLGAVENDCTCLVLNVSDDDFEQRLSGNTVGGGPAGGATFKEASANDGAYLLYTSGSTGKPKGVLVGRANLCSFVESYAEIVSAECPVSLQMGGTGRYLGLAGRAFDVHLSQMFMSWRFGMALATGERSLLLGDLRATIHRLTITHMSCVPSLLDHCDLVAEEVPSLVFLGVGGEKLTDRVRDTLASKLVVLNAYGPTETTIMCTVNRVHADSHVRDIGHVLPGNSAVVIDFDDRDEFSPVLRGRAGELCIRGDLVALGYHALDPSQKAASGFVTLPDGSRMYRTGDAVRMMADGRLHYLGRRDEQEKIRGQRLELGEVSQCAIAGANEGVHAATLIMQHQGLAKPLLITLIAPKSVALATQRRDALPEYLAAASETAKVAQHVHQYCRRHLPSYMVPDLVVAVSHLTQLAASGKTDVRRLKAWLATADTSQLFQLQDKGGLQVEAERQLTVMEAKVARAIGQILPNCSIDIRPSTSIFDLGIDSLSVIRLASQLRKHGLIVPIASLRMRPQIHQITSEASQTAKGRTEDPDDELDLSIGRKALEAFRARHRNRLEATRPEKLDDVLPCLPSQEGMVALSLSGSDTDLVYVARMRVRIDVDCLPQALCSVEDSLRRAWMRLAKRHSILRTCFDHVDDDTIAQVVLQHVDIERHVVRPRSGQSESSTALAILRDISAVPPWRYEFDQDTTSAATFVLHMHHALYDGHSLSLLLEGLTMFLRDEEVGAKNELPRMESLIESILAVPAPKAQSFWCGAFADFPVNEPSPWTRFDRVLDSTSGQGLVRCKASLQLSPLEAVAKQLQVTLSSLAAAALGVAMSRSLGTPAFTLGLVLWGRSLDVASAEKIAAPCLTTVPMPFLLCIARGSQSLGDVIRACFAFNSSCLAVQHTSMRQIRREIGSERQGSIAGILFSFIQSEKVPESTGWRLDQIEADTDAPAAVEVTVDAASDEVRISAMVKHVLPQEGLEGVIETLCLLLSKIASGTSADMDLEAAGVPSMSSTAMDWHDVNSRAKSDSKVAVRPMTEVEEKIRQLAVEMCGVPSADLLQLDTPFLHIGLDSIVALRFSARLRSECRLQLSAHDILASGSIEGLSQLLDRRQSETSAAGPAWSSTTDIARRYKATPLQAGMLNGTIASSSQNLYVHHHAVLLKDAIDYDRLQRALQRLVAAHDILRTSFHLEDMSAGREGVAPSALSWRAKVTPFDELLLIPQLSHHHSKNVPRTALQEYGADFCFDCPERFSVSPWRAGVLHCASQQDVLVLSMHHSLYDGVSLPFLFEDLKTAYRDETKQLMARQPFALAAELIDSTAERSEQHWQQTLGSFDRPSLLIQKPAQEAAAAIALAPYRLDHMRLAISSVDLKRLSAEVGTTPQAVALLSWAKVLAASSGQRDVCFGQVVSGRYLPLPGIEDVSGPLINTVPIRINLANDLASNAVTQRELQERIVASHPFQHASLARIQNAWRRDRAAHGTLFDSLFVFHHVQSKSQGSSDGHPDLWTGFDSSEASLELNESAPTGTLTAASEYPVNISVIQDDQGVLIKAGASDAVGGKEWLPRMLHLFAQVFLDLLHRPHRPVGAFPDALASLPLAASGHECQQEAGTSIQVGDGRRTLTYNEQKIVLRHLARRLKVEEGTIKACPNLFLLGIDSLLAICISADARGENVPLTPFDVLSAGTFAKLTVACDTAKEGTTGLAPRSTHQEPIQLVSMQDKQEAAELLEVAATDVEAVLPVLAGQKQHIDVWLQRGRRFLEPTFIYATEHTLDVRTLGSAWSELRRRNAALRTAFARLKDTNGLVQVVLSEDSPVWREHERSKLVLVDGGDDLDSAAFEAVKRLNASPSDLSRPSARLTLVQGKQKDLVLLTVHHTSYDAWSMRLMASELTRLYHRIEAKSFDSMPDPISWTRFVEQTYRDAMRSKDATRGFWDENLQGASPTLVCRGVQQSIEQTMHVRKAALKETDACESRCHKHGFGLQVVVVLAYARLLSSHAGAGDQGLRSPTFGFYTAGRSGAFEGLGELVGPTTAMQPMTVAVGADDGRDLLERLRTIQRKLVQRASHQQDDVVCSVTFDAHLNLLWHRPDVMNASGGEAGAETAARLKPYKLPYDSGYFTRHPLMPGRTSVDRDPSESALEANSTAQFYMDVSLDTRAGTLSLGARCDRSAMDAQQLEAFCDAFVFELDMCAGL